MFAFCYNLKYLDLSNFNTLGLDDISYMLQNCGSLEYLNLYSFKLKNSTTIINIFSSMSTSLKFCAEDIKLKNYILTNYQIESKCNEGCFRSNSSFVKIDFECINCSLEENKYEYNNICYSECPENTYTLFDYGYNNEDNKTECFDQPPEGYYFDINNKTYKKCFENCKYCYGEGNETINNCKECKSNLTFLNEVILNKNCFKKCDYNYFFDELDEYHCTEDLNCPVDYNKLIIDKNKCIYDCQNDSTYQYEYNNTCYSKCPNGTYLLEDDKDNLCYDKNPDGYYLDKDKHLFKKCFEACYKCYKGGNQVNHNCAECIGDYGFYINSLNISNCYEKCEHYYYFDESNEFHCVETCPKEYNKLIIDKNKCIDDCKNDDIYKYEYNNTCLHELTDSTTVKDITEKIE